MKKALFNNRYNKAIVRKPARDFAKGLTKAKLGRPDVGLAIEQHNIYCAALEECGVKLLRLLAEEKFPDGCFVEDTAIILDEIAIITKPSNFKRQGEELSTAHILSSYKDLEYIKSPGTLEGGDVLRVGNHFYIGLSKRTNQEGGDQLASILSKFGYTSSFITVNNILHLKAGITNLGNNHFIATQEYSNAVYGGQFITVHPNQASAANCLRINDMILMPQGHPNIKQTLLDQGKVIELDISEFEKMDGSLTCLSLLY